MQTEEMRESLKIEVDDFEAFYLKYVGLVRYTLRNLCGTYEQDREDIVQEVFLKAWSALQRGTLKHNKNLAAWVGITTQHTLADYLRKQERRRKYHENWNEEYALLLPTPSDGVNLILDGEFDVIRQAFRRLTQHDQTVLKRLVREGHVLKGHEDEHLGDNTAPTHDKIRRARENLWRRYHQLMS